MTIEYGEILINEQTDVFVVEAMWPKDKKERRRFSSYYVSAFDDIDHRSSHSDCYGTFDKINKDVAEVPSRVPQTTERTARFTCPTAALTYAARLTERGRLTAAQGREDWRKSYEGVIKTRVVREIVQRTRAVVKAAAA